MAFTLLPQRLVDKLRGSSLKINQTEFLSVVAHQLRTPLGSIRWNLEMVLSGDMGELSPELKESMMQIYQSVQRMIILVNQVLIVSRIDQNRVQDQLVPVDIIAVIKDVINEIKFVSRQEHVNVNLLVPHPINKIIIDPQRFRDVILNLISNAVKYTHINGQVIVEVKTNSDFIAINISDNGIGIPKKEQAKLFSKFFRASNALKSQTEGSGLGLFIVKSYVEAWGGKIEFKSPIQTITTATGVQGIGTTFTLTIPLVPKAHSLDQNLASQPLTSQ